MASLTADYVRTRVQTDHEKIYLGSFITAEEAAAAYNSAAPNFHGRFARLNKIGGCHT